MSLRNPNRPTFRRYQLLIILTAIVPFLILSAFIWFWGMHEYRTATERGLLNTSRALATAVDRQILAWQSSLYSLAGSPAFDIGDFSSLYAQARAVADRNSGDIVLFDTNLQQILNTRTPLGSKLPKAHFPEPVRRVLATGQPQISGPFFGAVAQQQIISVDAPVVRNGVVIYDLNMNFEPLVLGELLAAQDLPSGWVAEIVDERNAIVAHSPGKTDNRGNIVAPWYKEAVDAHVSGIATGRSTTGEPLVVGFERIPSAPWSVRVAAPESALAAAWRTPLLIFVVLDLAAVGVAVGGAWISSRRVTRKIDALTGAAADLLAGRPASLSPMTIREFETLRLALERAAKTARETIAAEERASAAEGMAAELRESEQRQRLLAREIDHRARNLLSLVISILELTRADNVEDFIAAFHGRIMALGRAHNLLAKSRWEGAELRQIIEEELAPYRGGEAHIVISGPALTLGAMSAQTIALVLHEMTTNAMKYGALSWSAGRLSVTWETKQGQFILHWTETGSPDALAPVTKKGFGTTMIKSVTERQFGGEVTFDWRKEGLSTTITLPQTKLAN